MFSNLKTIEPKDINTEEELEQERLRHAPVLGKDAWYACLWWAIWRMVTTQMLTRAGFWVFGSTVTLFSMIGTVLFSDSETTGAINLCYGAGGNCLLAWMWYCAPQQAKQIMEAIADRIRKTPAPSEPSK